MRSEDSEAKVRSEGAKVRAPGAATVRTVFVMVAANAATQFAIQAWMSYRFAKDVWAIPRPLCVSIIVALDLFAVTFMVFTYLLRTASAKARAYVWLVFAVGVSAQLFAAELYGAHEQWKLPVRVFAGLPALFLAASLHGLIIWRNHASKGTNQPAPIAPPIADRTQGPAPVSAKPRPGAKPKTSDKRDAFARRVVEQGERPADLAPQAGVSKRAIELWVQDYRKRLPAPQVNGHEFHADGPAEVAVN